MSTPLPFEEDRQEGEVVDGDVDAEDPKLGHRVSQDEPLTGVSQDGHYWALALDLTPA